MPLNTLRLNHQKSSHPNDRIVFIKPLPRPPSDRASYEIADTFLRAIAAQCLPLMKKHYLSVTTLEEHEPNREFIGRNFNNGEIIQLVLTTRDGRWVPFNAVQMVMMHELAHNTHMNHGRDFWKTRNVYAEEMKALWAKRYTGEGFWGGGRTLHDMGSVIGNNTLRSDELERLPLCGGTYRSRNRKRRGRSDKPELTWKEKRDRRIEKKFGKNGIALGEDEDKRLSLEVNRKGPIGAKPRVAQSARGRELRAAAALARFDTNKKEVEDIHRAERTKTESSGDEDEYEDLDAGLEDARDVYGRKILDTRGHGMIRVCSEEDDDETQAHARQELQELNTLDRYFTSFQKGQGTAVIRAGMEALPGSPGKTGTATPPPPTVTRGATVAGTLESDTDSSPWSPPAAAGKQQPRGSSSSSTAESAVQSHLLPNSGSTLRQNHVHQNIFPPGIKQPRNTPSASLDSESSNGVPTSTTASLPSAKPKSLKSRSSSSPMTMSTVGPLGRVPGSPFTTKSGSSSNSNSPVSPRSRPQTVSTISCPICSLENPSLNATCMACSHVLDPRKDPRSWSCQSAPCVSSGTAYLNAGDVRVCGVCGVRRNNNVYE
ncbi:hypothetical protein G647_00464 [Cladophialophora carrionii CBS 160.54]|uniref:WLM domain-containing protein n=1 Tax=Cladophialophora carrionii CBS 160.54 TaxID=1279043 RepID=V9DMC5_9EURO|nr:uncharacterized protein G647_00464 [Cladophialophora carrionii CBS 160.54]ETI28015.1 hypothetical protein G647_00464 [Cladophialophora carrionii CBS 160.54]